MRIVTLTSFSSLDPNLQGWHLHKEVGDRIEQIFTKVKKSNLIC